VKTLSVVTVISIALIGTVAVCQEQRELADFRVVMRRGLAYEVNSEIPFTGTTVSYWPDGQKRVVTEYRDGQRVRQAHYKSGQKEIESEYRDGREHGTATIWSGNGQMVAETEYRNGKRNGKQTKWYKNGQKMQEGEYRNDVRVGKWITWSSSGQKVAEVEYLKGEEISRKELGRER
jgi:antitoxin component YwqK of YwqJK toxin-antitoxin module